MRSSPILKLGMGLYNPFLMVKKPSKRYGSPIITDVIFSGCGSTYFLSFAAATLFQQMTGHLARAIPGGELFMYPGAAYYRDCFTLLVAISRSGTTTETITAVKRFRERQRGPVIVVTSYGIHPFLPREILSLSFLKDKSRVSPKRVPSPRCISRQPLWQQ